MFRHVPPQVPPTWGGGEVHDGTHTIYNYMI